MLYLAIEIDIGQHGLKCRNAINMMINEAMFDVFKFSKENSENVSQCK